ncbi:MAG: GIY-YIG nuclease family protein [Pseudomonadota bacterium]
MDVVGFVYILKCADKSYYIGSHRGNDVMTRVAEHENGLYPKAYTFRRRPVKLAWSEYFTRYDEMVAFERQIKGWSRWKKEALIDGEWQALPKLSTRGFRPNAGVHPSRRSASAAPQDEE